VCAEHHLLAVNGRTLVAAACHVASCLQICDLNLAKLLDTSSPDSSSMTATNPRWLVRRMQPKLVYSG
jgi:hypothetical protein